MTFFFILATQQKHNIPETLALIYMIKMRVTRLAVLICQKKWSKFDPMMVKSPSSSMVSQRSLLLRRLPPKETSKKLWRCGMLWICPLSVESIDRIISW